MKIINKYNKIINEFEIYIGTIIFIAMTILLTLQVLSRYLLGDSFVWAEELSVIMFVWLIYLGVAGAITKRKHLRIDAFVNILPFKIKKAVLILDNFIIIIFCAYVILPFSNLIANLIKSGVVTSILRIPRSVVYAVIPVCLLLTCVRTLQDTVVLVGESEGELGVSKPTIDIEALEREALLIREAKKEHEIRQLKEAGER